MTTTTADALTTRATVTTPTRDERVAVCLRSFQIMVDGTLDDFVDVVHPEAVNREAKDEPTRNTGSRARRLLRDGPVAAQLVR